MRERNYADRSILVLGGSSGIGMKAVAELARAGATVFLGTRNPHNFERAKQQLGRREKLDVESLHVHPFIADVTNKRQLEEAAQEMKAKDPKLTDVVFSHATGMDGFTEKLFKKHMDPISDYTFNTPIEELAPDQRETVEDKLMAMRADLEVWTNEALPQAIATNYQGTFDAIEVLENTVHKEIRKLLYNSTWGFLSGTPGVEIPLLYRPVDRSRAMLRNRIAKDGIRMAMIVASLVNDTQVGKMFNEFFCNLMDKEQREAVKSSSIEALDVVGATMNLLDSDPSNWPVPYNVFVYRKDGIVVVENQLELSAMYTAPYRF